MQGIERDQVAREAELAEQRLSGRDLVGLVRPYVALATNVDTGCILANVRVMFFLSA
jgi:hypothetical protein